MLYGHMNVGYYDYIQDIFYEYLDKYRHKKQDYVTLKEDKAISTASVHIRPILVHSNTAGFGFLNSWNGSRLYIDENNQEYLLAPIVGAGAKENGGFTGVVMGLRSLTKQNNKQQLIGLHGYAQNTPTFFINAKDGSAIFGKSTGGQIVIDPSQNNGYIYSANYWNEIGDDLKPLKYTDKNKSNKGMLLFFGGYDETEEKNRASYIHLADTSGFIYSGKHSYLDDDKEQGFYLSSNGLSIVGKYKDKKNNKIYTSRIELDTSEKSPYIFSNNHSGIGSTQSGFYLGENGLSIGTNFIINADSTATIGNDGSTIGGWTVEVERENGKPKLDKEGRQIILGFKSKDGKGIYLDSNNSIIALGSSAGKIHSGEHTNHSKKNNGFCLDNKGLSIGSNFKIDTSGIPFISLGHDAGKIYSGQHDSLKSLSKGFYLGNNGLSLYNSIRITAEDDNGKVEIGRLGNNKHWTIGGKLEETPLYEVEDGVTYQTSHFKGTKILRYRKLYELVKDVQGPHDIVLPDGHVVRMIGDIIQRSDMKELKDAQKYVYDEPQYPEEDFDIYIESHKKNDLILRDRKLYLMLKNVDKNSLINYSEDDEKNSDFKNVDNSYYQKYEYSPSYSYIGFNTDELSVYEENDTSIIGEPYSYLDFSEDARNNQVYIGTDGFRLARSFAVDYQGNATLKGTIQANHGFIGENAENAWHIGKGGLYKAIDKKDTPEKDCIVNGKYKTKNLNDPLKITFTYKKAFIILSNGEIGFEYYFTSSFEENYYTYNDRTGWSDEKTLKVEEGDKVEDVISLGNLSTIKSEDLVGWHGYDNGSFNVHYPGSNFGGVRIARHDGGQINTFYESEWPTNSDPEYGVFRLNCQSEISGLAQNALRGYINDIVDAAGLDPSLKVPKWYGDD